MIASVDTSAQNLARLIYLLGWPHDEPPMRATCEEAAQGLFALAAERHVLAARVARAEEALRAVETARYTNAPHHWKRVTKLTSAALAPREAQP